MVRVDVFDLEWRQLLRQLGTHQRVAQRPNAKRRRSAALPQQGPQDLPKALPIGGEPPGRPHQVLVRERLEIPRLFPKTSAPPG